MQAAKKSIITCALTGGVHTPSMSPGLPVTAAEMVEQGRAAADAGAAILHLHARDSRDGRPVFDPEAYRPFVTALAHETDAVINITTGGGLGMTVEQRLAAAMEFEPELASLNMGSLNFNFSAAAAKERQWLHEWERPFVLASEGAVFANSFDQIVNTLELLGRQRGCRFEFECYDVGHLYNLAHIVDRGLAEPPFLIQAIFGILGGIGPDVENLAHMVSIADKLFGGDYLLSAFGAGRHQMTFATASALMGGSVRVGLEDNLYIRPGELARDNAEQVTKIRRLLEELGKTVATPEEARVMLHLKGADQVKIAEPVAPPFP
ncbi:3-keto-5-aminohexanoate cleavage protein [Spirillospora sp. NPDC048819]|uniref:3-keto-5-aminohexanoate cleavage protein n=1 Tax=Spirillospora sp. NPDC048819 TaxID=3155268 RepID=UPI0033F135F6